MEHPLFRTIAPLAAVQAVAEPPLQQQKIQYDIAAPDARTGDLTFFVGATVNDAEWAILQERIAKKQSWMIDARPDNGGWHVTDIFAGLPATEDTTQWQHGQNC